MTAFLKVTDADVPGICKDILTINNKRIERADFVKYFLPIMTGESDYPIESWLKVAGGYKDPVEVYENGKLIYTVPAIMASNLSLDHSAPGSISMSTVLQEGKLHMNRHQQSGLKYLTEHLTRMVKGADSSEADLKAWEYIFAYEGKLGDSKKAEVVKEASLEEGLSDDWEEA